VSVGPGDSASVSVLVAVPPERAFAVFTREIDAWWKRGPKYRIAGKERGVLTFEEGVGGRLFETFLQRGSEKTFEVGRVTAWSPPDGLEFEWRGVNFAAGESTRVSVRFEPSRSGTLVTVRHSGWSALRDDHPVRHGLRGADFSRMIGLWWGELMTSLREHAAG
jgi:uncharacterized protein YndB with AHSA1/START domain